MKNYLILLILSLVSLSFTAQNTGVQARFDQANEAYNNAKYEQAISLYKSILNEGLSSAELHYNLANAALKDNNLGQAVLHYEKALKLDPDAKNIQENLAYANRLTIDEIKALPKSQIQVYIEQFNYLLSVDQWSYLTIAFAIFMLVSFIGFSFIKTGLVKRVMFSLVVVFLIFSGVSLSQAYRLNNLQQAQNYAVIQAEEVKALAEPNARSNEVFTLHEGTKIELLSSFNDYQEIRLIDGTVAWIQGQVFEEI